MVFQPCQDVQAQRASLRHRDHRPWDLPDRPWIMGQTWHDLLFAHWPVDPNDLVDVMPPELPVDLWEGAAWIGVTPFLASGTRPRWALPMPLLSSFPEVNVRTYVELEGKPGIYFFSLDTNNPLAVLAARRTYRLPYFRSEISSARAGTRTNLSLGRVSSDGPPARLEISYEPVGEAKQTTPGNLDHWLTERYCLYTLDSRRRVQRGDIHHRPWTLREASARIDQNSMTEGLGLDLPGSPLLHFAPRQDVIFWPIVPVQATHDPPI